MNYYRVICIIAAFFTSIGYSFAENPELNTIIGKINIGVKTKTLSVLLDFHFVDERDSSNSISLLLTSDVKIHELTGQAVESYSLNTDSKPLTTVKIKFKDSFPRNSPADFSMSYSGVISKGIWDAPYHWIDLDPDFMNLPIFLSLNNFSYQLSVDSDDSTYLFCNFQTLNMAPAVNIISEKPSYYFSSVVAGQTAKLKTIVSKDYRINIISNKPDSVVDSLGKTGAEIIDFYNNSFGRKDTINSFLIVYRPLPDSILPVIRTLDRSIMFSLDHSKTAVLAHEIAQFWWNRGNAFSTEKWLTESFAEYSGFMYARSHDKELYKTMLKRAGEVGSRAPAIIGSERFGDHADALLYFKGPYLLAELEKEIGHRKFIRFLIALNQNKVDTTSELLSELSRITSKPVSDKFERLLNK